MDAWEEAGAWEAEDDLFDGSFADEDEEGPSTWQELN